MKWWGLALAGVTFGNCPAWSQGKTWAVVVGIDEYVKPSIPRLRYAVSDAKLFAQALRDVLKVPPENLFVLTSDSVDENSQPRVVNLAYRLGWLDEKVGKDDTVIFYFAGHGVTVEGQPFLLTEEADNRSGATLKVSAMHGGEVISALRKTDCARVWVVLDACRNSPGARGETRLEGDLAGAFSHADVGREQSATMFSCNVGERAWESDELKHGYYTYYLVEGLQRQAADAAGRVTLQGLHDYSAHQVKAASKKLGSAQNPRLFYGGASANEWVLTRVQAVAGAARPTGIAEYVAQLELLQARLDKEVALRVAAEQRARSEESRRLELEQRLALMEKGAGLSSSAPLPAKQPPVLAYAERGYQDELKRQEALSQEVARLQEENRRLQQRLNELQGNLGSQGMASRDVQLEESLALERSEEARWQSATAADPSEQLENCLKVRESQIRQVTLMEKAFAAELTRRMLPEQRTEVASLQQNLALQQQATRAFAQMNQAARQAAQEAGVREQLSQARLNHARERIQELERQLQDADRARSEARAQAEQAEQQLAEAVALHQSRWHDNFWSRNPWMIRGRRIISDVLDIAPRQAESFQDKGK